MPILVFAQTPIEKTKTFLAKKEYVKAEKEIKTFVDNNPLNKEALELLGDAYGYQKKWDNAIEKYKALTKLDSNNANFHYKYGGALGMKALSVSKLKALGIIGDIKAAFLKAAELDPKHIDARWALVELYMSLPGVVGGSKKKSLQYANELEVLSKVDGYLAKGYIYEYDDEPELAEKYYKLAVKVGGSITCYEKLSNLYESQNQPEKAMETIEASHKKHHRNALHYQLGKVSADYGVNLDKGESCLLNYIKQYSAADGVPIEWAYYRLAQIYKHRKDKAKALGYIEKALAIRADFKQALAEKKAILSS
ncbi:tetratricopeptide repeat protein [Winogradskyella litorisediminis]|uniref:Tetratricopeptide repeat protein n=1 Tax=Winogradskyella litorisediminis TaxID=1156618 RepID=A0ABW3N882_9FLAO